MRISDWSSDVCSSDLLIEYLGQYRAPQAMTALAQIDQNQDRIAGIGTQLGRERCARIGNRCECRHDKGYRCNHFMPPAVVPPGCAHGQRILAHGYGQTQTLTPVADRCHGIVEPPNLARPPPCRSRTTLGWGKG